MLEKLNGRNLFSARIYLNLCATPNASQQKAGLLIFEDWEVCVTNENAGSEQSQGHCVVPVRRHDRMRSPLRLVYTKLSSVFIVSIYLPPDLLKMLEHLNLHYYNLTTRLSSMLYHVVTQFLWQHYPLSKTSTLSTLTK